jgi:hypothetical protein
MTDENGKKTTDGPPVNKKVRRCYLCNESPRFSVLAVRFDGDLLGAVDYCRQHALDVALGREGLPLAIPACRVDPPLDRCYRDGCDCLPIQLDRCARCTRLADVWLVGGTDEDLEDLRRGVNLCAFCAIAEVGAWKAPVEFRRGLQNAVEREDRARGPSSNE